MERHVSCGQAVARGSNISVRAVAAVAAAAGSAEPVPCGRVSLSCTTLDRAVPVLDTKLLSSAASTCVPVATLCPSTVQDTQIWGEGVSEQDSRSHLCE